MEATVEEPLKVVMDPRVKASTQELEQQFTMAKRMYDDLMKATAAMHEISVLREQLKARSGQPAVGQAGPTIDSKLDAIAGTRSMRDCGFWARTGGAGDAGIGADATRAADALD